jgi:Subtilase family
MSEHELPAWDVPRDATSKIALQSSWPAAITRDWAFGDSTGKGARVCILDSGVELGDPLVGEVQSAVVVTAGEDGEPRIDEDAEGDVCGHGTACAGIVRALAPEAEIHSVRVLGPGYTGSGKILLAGLRHAIEQRFDIVNMSLSTTKKDHAAVLHQLADAAYFKRMVLVASAVAWLGEMRDDPLHRQQLRDAARRRDLRARPLQASRADAVRAEEPAPPDLAQRGGSTMSDTDLNAAVAAGVLGSEERFRELLRSVVEVARAIFSAKASSVLLLDEAANELVFEAVVRRGRGEAARDAVPGRRGRGRLGARDADAARDRGGRPRPALRQGRRRGHRVRFGRA